MDKKYFDVRTDVIEPVKNRYGRTPSLIYCVGMRGVGKTHSALKECLLHALEGKGYFVYIRRVTTEIDTASLNSVFSDVIRDPEVLECIDISEYGGYTRYVITARSGAFYLCGIDSVGGMFWLQKVGVATCITKAEHFKGGTYSDFDRAIFDEFITERGYISGDKEPEYLQKIIATMGRAPNDERASKHVITYLCGNPDNSIEACPYLYALHLDYANMQPNKPYYYERRNGEISTFIKIARSGDQYIDPSTVGMFDTSEEVMTLTGEAKTNNYMEATPHIFDKFKAKYKLLVETPVITNTEYHKIIYAYYGILKDVKSSKPALIICGHDTIKGRYPTLYCRYDADLYIDRKEPQTYRLNIPPDPRYMLLKTLIANVDATQLVFTTANKYATLFDTIKSIS